MRRLTSILALGSLCTCFAFAQYGFNQFGPSAEFPYGKPNPAAAIELWDYYELIGHCDCISQQKDSLGNWGEPQDMSWTFRYVLDGNAIQDEMIRSDGKNIGSIRQYDQSTDVWSVQYYGSDEQLVTHSAIGGKRQGSGLSLEFTDQSGFPQCMMRFADISEGGFTWSAERLIANGNVRDTFWRIECIKWPD